MPTLHPLLIGKTLLFDVDGTIAETEGLGHLPAFNRAFAQAGLSWNWSVQDYAELLKVTGGYERMIAYADRRGDPIAQTVDGKALLRSVHQQKNTFYAQALVSGAVEPRAGFFALVQAIVNAGQQWAVVTTTSRSNWDELWTHAICRNRAAPPPVLAVCGEDVRAKKPDPEAYTLALSRLGISAGQAIALEDSRNGLLAARAAGIETVVVRSQFFGHEAFAEASLVVDALGGLVAA